MNENVKNKISEHLKNKISLLTVCTYFSLANRFKITSLAKETFYYFERCFTMVVETKSFIQIDFEDLRKILCSCKLQVDTELEVFNAANTWVNCNTAQRRKFTKDLLSKVRLPLLSKYALTYILDLEDSCFSSSDDCVATIKKCLENKNKSMRVKDSDYYKSRHCSQNMFKILVYGGYSIDADNKARDIKDVHEVEFESLTTVKKHPSMIEERRAFNAVCVKGDVYILSDRLKTFCIQKYSPATNTWEKAADMYGNRKLFFSACSFMDSIFAVGCLELGCKNGIKPEFCLEFSTRDRTWREIARMEEKRVKAACAVFEGRVVVSGGHYQGLESRTVEAYDHIADEWSRMPCMSEARSSHGCVAVGSKLFVIGGCIDLASEMFESVSNQFVAVKRNFIVPDEFNFVQVHSIGRKFRVFGNHRRTVWCYDVDKEEWSLDSCELTKDIGDFRCVKLPVL